MREDTPSLVPIAYQSQNYKTGRVLGDYAGKTFLTNEELSNELYGGCSLLETFKR